MTRVNVPPSEGHPGGWFDLRPASVLGPDEQDEYLDLIEEIREKKRQAAPAVDPANPAVLAARPDEVIKLTRKDLFPVWGYVIGLVVSDSSWGPLAPWTLEKRRELGLPGWNVLKTVIDPYWGLLNGNGPKEETEEDTPTFAATSSDSADAPRTEPAAAT